MERKMTPQERYAKKNIKQFKIDCVINTESDIIDKLMSVPNRAAVLAFFCKFEFSMIKYSVLWAGMVTFWLSCLIVI